MPGLCSVSNQLVNYKCPLVVFICIPTSHKKVFLHEKSACRDGSLKNQPNYMGMTPQHFHTIPTSCTILPPLTQIILCYLFVSCVQRKVVEGSGVGSGGCVVHFDVHGSELCCGLLQCSCYNEHGRYGLS